MTTTDHDKTWAIRSGDGALWGPLTMTEPEAREIHRELMTGTRPHECAPDLHDPGATVVNLLDELAARLPAGRPVKHIDTGVTGVVADDPCHAIDHNGGGQVCVNFGPGHWHTWVADYIAPLEPGEVPVRRLPSRLPRLTRDEAVAVLTEVAAPTYGRPALICRRPPDITILVLDEATRIIDDATDIALSNHPAGRSLLVLTADGVTHHFEMPDPDDTNHQYSLNHLAKSQGWQPPNAPEGT